MKKLVFLSLFLFFTATLWSQNDSTLLEKLSPEQLNAVERVYVDFSQKIDNLAQTLKVPAEEVWKVLVLKHKTKASILIVLYPVGLIVFAVSFFIFLTYTIKNWEQIEENDTEPLWVIITGMFGLAMIGFMVGCFTGLPEEIVRFKVPEYYAIREIMDIL